MRLVQGVPECRERQYVFDRAFDGDADNREVYRHMVHGIVPGVLRGFNATVFAYGATGSGKTYTMVGTEEDPGLMGERCEREGGARGAPWHHARISETLAGFSGFDSKRSSLALDRHALDAPFSRTSN